MICFRQTRSVNKWKPQRNAGIPGCCSRVDGVLLRTEPIWRIFSDSAVVDLSPIEWIIRKMAQNLHMQTGTWLTRRELTEVAGAWDARLCVDDDGEYFCRVPLASDGVRFVPGAKVFYRLTPSSRLSYIGWSDKKKDAQLRSMQLHVKYILSLENSDRVRASCMAYLQTWLINFYPERPDIVQELEGLAMSLGGRLEVPRLRWKYAWIKPLFGWVAAKNAQIVLPQLKASIVRFWGKTMYELAKSARKNFS